MFLMNKLKEYLTNLYLLTVAVSRLLSRLASAWIGT